MRSARFSGGVMIGLALIGRPTSAQPPSSTHVTIPFLANATRPADLDFQGGDCTVDRGGSSMRCEFQQVLLTTSDIVPDTCLITTNSYERVFQKEGSARWVSQERPEGACGVMDVATLQDEGGVRWTLEMRKVVTKKDAAAACRAVDEARETMSWRNIRRALPCKFVQPGGIGR